MRLGLPVIVFLACVPLATAATPFTADLPFTDMQRASRVPLLSGATTVDSAAGGAPTILSDVAAFEIHGVTVACWQYPCLEGNDLAVRVVDGSTVALRFPATGTLHLEADSALSVPVDLDAVRGNFGRGLTAGLTLAPSLAAATSGGILTFLPETLDPEADGPAPAQSPIPGLPPALASQFQAPDPTDENAAVLAGLTNTSRLEVVQAGRVVQVLPGYAAVLLQGDIVVQPVTAHAFLIPCTTRCDLDVTAKAHDTNVVAAMGSLFRLVEQMQGSALPDLDLGSFGSLLNPIAAGAFVELPLNLKRFSVANLTVVRFEHLQTSLFPGSTAADGSGELVILSGEVKDAPAFVGTKFFGMPLWSYVLWGAALVVLVLRVVLRRDQPKPESGKWLARLVGLAAFLLLALFWHLAFVRVLGVGATSSGLNLTSRLIIGAIEFGTLLSMVLMVVTPARILLGNALRLAGLPKLAPYAPAAGRVVGIVVGLPLLLGLVNFALGLFQ